MKRLLVSLICICLCVGLASAQKIYLVCVGVADYPGTKYDLRLPVKDAETIQWVYQKNKRAETVLLTNSQATRENVLNTMKKSFSKASANDIIVLFFSGHGDGKGFVGYDGTITYGDVRKVMAASRSKNKMILADACLSGNMRKPGRDNSPSSMHVMLFLSSRGNESSYENPNMSNGYFTACLQRALRGGADANRDRIITARELFQFVSPKVAQMSDGLQHPVMWGKFDDNMPVMVW